ncbi:hypothetical protein BGZ73_008544 [Actinomortierella ambigua]|nr:hypothetical protein BGZ73_008544 [Actinomortierella ambigua]
MPRYIPGEILRMISDHVDDDDYRTLFGLLTLSKALFHAAVEKLWADPFHFDLQLAQFLRLFKFVLAISPCRRKEAEYYRKRFQVTRLPSESEPGPYIDYLALVRHGSGGLNFLYQCQASTSPVRFHSILPWVICNGQLGQLTSLTLHPLDVKSVLELIPTMTQLVEVRWTCLEQINGRLPAAYVEGISEFVKAFVAEHGKHGRRIDMHEFYAYDQPDVEVVSMKVLHMCRLLGPCRDKQVIDNPYDWERCIAHKDIMDFSRIQEIRLAILEEHLDDIMSRCPRLHELSIAVCNVPQFLYWFSKQGRAHSRLSVVAPAPTRPLLSVVPPLKRISLGMPRNYLSSIMVGLASSFGSTLEMIDLEIQKVRYHSDDDEGYKLDADIYDTLTTHAGRTDVLEFRTALWSFPNLQTLVICNNADILLVFDQSDMSGMPNLEHLKITSPYMYDDEHSSFPPAPPYDTTLMKPCGVWKLPKLRLVKLDTALAWQFNLESLAWSPEMLVLDLDVSLGFIDMIDTLLTTQSVAAEDGGLVKLWPDVRLPKMEDLRVSSDIARDLNLETIARSMPNLKVLKVHTGDDLDCYPEEPLLSRFIHGMSPAMKRKEPSPFPLQHLTYLELAGEWIQEDQDFHDLLLMNLLPNLTELSVHNIYYEPFTWLIDSACQSATLQHVEVESVEGYSDALIHPVLLGLGFQGMPHGPTEDSDMRFTVGGLVGYKQREHQN